MAVTIHTEGLVDKDRLRQTLLLIREAGEKGITKVQLAKKLGNVSSRTVDRAVMLLEEQGAKIGKPRLGHPAVIHFTLLKGPTWDESVSGDARLALRLAGLMLAHGGTVLWKGKQEVLERLAGSSLSTRDRAVFGELAQAVVEHSGEVPQDILEPLLRALQGSKSLELEVLPGRGKAQRLEVVPHALVHDVFTGGALLVAWESAKARIQYLRLGRIQKAKVLRQTRVPDPDLLARVTATQVGGLAGEDAPFEVVVQVEGEVTVMGLKEAPPALPGFRCTLARDGKSARVTFQASHSTGALRWVLQFGAQAEILEPAWLRSEAKVQLETACKRYKRGSRSEAPRS